MSENEWWTAREISRLVPLTHTTIQIYLNRGDIKGEKDERGRWRVHRDDLEAWLKATGRAPIAKQIANYERIKKKPFSG